MTTTLEKITLAGFLILSLAACGGSSSGDGSVATPQTEGSSSAALLPANATQLSTLLATRYDSADSFDYWSCESTAGRALVLLTPLDTFDNGLQVGFEIIDAENPTDTLWTATSASTLTIEYPSVGQAIEYASISFSDINTVRIGAGANTPQNCVRESFGNSNAPTQPSNEPAPVNTESTVIAGNGPPGLVGMFGILVYRILPSGFFGPTDDAILAFDDGSYTKDVSGVMRIGVAASRMENPEDWGEWRGTSDDLQLRESGESEFEEISSWLIQPGGQDQRLDECFTAIGGAGALGDFGIGSVNFSTVCFLENGQFTHDRALITQGPFANATSVSPESVGVYRIDGHVAVFSYSSGRSETVAFGINNRENGVISSIYINDDLHID